MTKRKLIAVICAVSCLVLAGCTIRLNGVGYKDDVSELKAVIAEGETKKLDKFKNLSSFDATGSTNYAELLEWAEAHPTTDVSYSVIFPNGAEISNKDDSANLAGSTSEDLPQVIELMGYLPNLKEADFGSGLSVEEIRELQELYPNVLFNSRITISGKEYVLADSIQDFSKLGKTEVDAAVDFLSIAEAVETVKLSEELGIENIEKIASACPNAVIDCDIDAYGKMVNLSSETLDLRRIPVEDDGAFVRRLLPLMRNCTFLDMDNCGVDSETMAGIRDDFPEIKVVWRIWFGTLYSVRTDVETILASNPDKGGELFPEAIEELKYCTDVVNLDLGHNTKLSDISFLYYMPKVETLIFLGGTFPNCDPIGSLENLDYLEMQTNEGVKDISALANCKNLRHLNMCRCPGVKDISPLYELPNLERLWIGTPEGTPYPEEQLAHLQELRPNLDIRANSAVDFDPVQDGWRFIVATYGYGTDVLHPRYQQIRDTFHYDYDPSLNDRAYAYYYNDPLYFADENQYLMNLPYFDY